MKRFGAIGKTLAAWIMLLALVSLLLPCFQVKTPVTTTSISGYEMIKIGAGLGYEHYRKGAIDNNYELKGGLTWGQLKSSINYVAQNEELRKAELAGAVCILPVVFCFLAMVLTFMAIGKKTMLLPTLLIALAFLENIVIVLSFGKLQNLFLSQTQGSGISLGLLSGIYAFTLLCGIAFVIILLLWFTGGFNRPKRRERDSDDKDDDSNEKERSSWRDRRGKKRRRKRKSGRKKRKKTKSSKEQQKNNKNNSQEQDEKNTLQEAAGRVSGVAGIYQGIDIDLVKRKNGSFTIGTTPEAMNRILSGSVEQIDGESCMISYDASAKEYCVVNHSDKNIILHERSGNRKRIRLTNGASATTGADTVIYIGDSSNAVKLD